MLSTAWSVWSGDLFKAFDFTEHVLLMAKLYAYGFDKNSLHFSN